MQTYEELLRALVHPKTKKLLNVYLGMNDWMVQVVVEKTKRWHYVYYRNPPHGVPEFVAGSKQEALDMVWQEAYEETVKWLPSLLEKEETNEV